MFLGTQHGAGSTYAMDFITVLQGTSATAQETVTCTASQDSFIAKLAKAEDEATLDC